MSDDDKKTVDHTEPTCDPGNMTLPTSIDELPDDLRQKIQAKLTANLEAFLASCFKDRQGNVTRYCEPIFGELTAPKVKDNKVVEDPCPTHANYAKMLQDHRIVTDNNLMTVVNMIMSRFDRLEAKKVDCVDASTSELASKQPQYGMPYIFYEN
ncbi:unnamed protein product [Miscanthus lutarioriparius]|uniref:Uncharacterized protein n=1 Tax=Miscanthus lutarioriparius TaxID=422564 RepID=A0A811S703_9POAL|nr:unnamed protein product [Miscanthus lutarioriparius]